MEQPNEEVKLGAYAKYIKPRLEDPEFKAKRNEIIRARSYKRYHEDPEYKKRLLEYHQKNKDMINYRNRVRYHMKKMEKLAASMTISSA